MMPVMGPGSGPARNGVDAMTSLTRPNLPTGNALTTWVRRSPVILLPIASLLIDAEAITPLRASSRAVELVKPSIVSSPSSSAFHPTRPLRTHSTTLTGPVPPWHPPEDASPRTALWRPRDEERKTPSR
jgi:hypothetical protein